MLKIGVLGAGHLGKIHIKCIKEIENFKLIGFYDPNAEIAQQAAKEFEIKSFNSIAELIDLVDAVDIVTPTISHFNCASKALKKSETIISSVLLTSIIKIIQKFYAQEAICCLSFVTSIFLD